MPPTPTCPPSTAGRGGSGRSRWPDGPCWSCAEYRSAPLHRCGGGRGSVGPPTSGEGIEPPLPRRRRPLRGGAGARVGHRSPLDHRSAGRHPRVPPAGALRLGRACGHGHRRRVRGGGGGVAGARSGALHRRPAGAAAIGGGRAAPGGRLAQPATGGGLRRGRGARRRDDPHGLGRGQNRRHSTWGRPRSATCTPAGQYEWDSGCAGGGRC